MPPLYSSYLRRYARAAIDLSITDTPVVCLMGPRQCGKTTLAKSLAPEREFITLDDPVYLKSAQSDPLGFVNQLSRYCTIDEIQRAPELLPCIKLSVDNDRHAGRFLLTGSANILTLPQVTESLAGRMETIDLFPLTEAERDQSESHFVRDLINGTLEPKISGRQPESGLTLPERIISGGYPEPATRHPLQARRWHRAYLKSIINRDVHDIADVREEKNIQRLLHLLATRTGELLNTSNLARDLGMHRETVDSYLAILETLFLIRTLPAWHINSGKRLVKSPKVHLIDSGLASSLADLGPGDWNGKRDLMGHLLETFVIQQIIAQSKWTDPDLEFFHFRDKERHEVDLVIERYGKVWGIEVKAAASLQPRDLKGLTKLADQAGDKFQQGIIFYDGSDIIRQKDPRFLAVPLNRFWK